MSAAAIPQPNLAPTVPEELASEQRITLWAEVMDACDELLLAGLRRQVGPDGDVLDAYRPWDAEHMAEHERTLIRMLERLGRCEEPHGL